LYGWGGLVRHNVWMGRVSTTQCMGEEG